MGVVSLGGGGGGVEKKQNGQVREGQGQVEVRWRRVRAGGDRGGGGEASRTGQTDPHSGRGPDAGRSSPA